MKEKNSLGSLKRRLEELQVEFMHWTIDLGEFCIDKKHTLQAKQKIVRDFALWLDSIARQVVPLSEICDKNITVFYEKIDNGNKGAEKKNNFNRKCKYCLNSRFYWGWITGVWTVLIIGYLFVKFFC